MNGNITIRCNETAAEKDSDERDLLQNSNSQAPKDCTSDWVHAFVIRFAGVPKETSACIMPKTKRTVGRLETPAASPAPYRAGSGASYEDDSKATGFQSMRWPKRPEASTRSISAAARFINFIWRTATDHDVRFPVNRRGVDRLHLNCLRIKHKAYELRPGPASASAVIAVNHSQGAGRGGEARGTHSRSTPYTVSTAATANQTNHASRLGCNSRLGVHRFGKPVATHITRKERRGGG